MLPNTLLHCYIIPVKIRSFYFKLTHRALPCNYALYNMKITQITTDFAIMYQRPYAHVLGRSLCKKLWKTSWDRASIFTAENIDTKICNIICNLNISLKQNQILRAKTSFCQFLTWLLPGLKKMLFLIISNTEGVRVLVCLAIFWTYDGLSGKCFTTRQVLSPYIG